MALIEMLRVGAAVERAAQRVGVRAVAALQRRGVFAQLGQRPVTALADLLGVEHVEARRVVTAAEQVIPRADLQGQVLPARLPATAQAFAAGQASVRHVEVIARLMGGAAAGRLTPDTWQTVEQQLAAQVGNYTPTVLRDWGANLLDQDGARPDDRDPREGNELRLTRDLHGGGWLKGRLTDAAIYDQIAALIDAKSAPLTADDRRPLEQRQAEAMAEVFGWVAAHGDTTVAPTTGGRRPQVNVLIRLEDLQNRAHAACLDHGGTPPPHRAAPAVLRRRSHPPRPGRGRATTGRRAPGPHRPGRDAPRGHRPRPGLRPPRLHPPTKLVRNPPHPRMGTRRRHGIVERRASSPTLTPLLGQTEPAGVTVTVSRAWRAWSTGRHIPRSASWRGRRGRAVPVGRAGG